MPGFPRVTGAMGQDGRERGAVRELLGRGPIVHRLVSRHGAVRCGRRERREAAVDRADVDDDDFDALHRLGFVRERRGSDLAAEDFGAAEGGSGAHGLHGGKGETDAGVGCRDADDDGFVAVAVGGAVPGTSGGGAEKREEGLEDLEGGDMCGV